ncbi:MAG: T9SS type A sorting domain-containing protein [Flavobacteriales bacterium]|nr:T9SS type A sorting domain-containing protein [Flavobacteriales bacterium]
MKKKGENSRRQFLKNTSLAALGAGFLPIVGGQLMAAEAQTDACDPTTLDYYGEGPFYTSNPPEIVNGMLADAGATGSRIIISGRVTNLDCTKVIPDAIIDMWHADDSGAYDNVGYKFRGKTKTNSQGFYMFETIQPGKYLNGAQYRPSHIHFKITAPGKSTITTQLYFQGDTSIPIDAAASITSGTYDATHRIIALTAGTGGKLEGTWDIAVAGEGVDPEGPGTSISHIEKGMIYKTFPNPFTDRLTVNYGVFKPARISLMVYDMQGNTVAQLAENEMAAAKYEAVWEPLSDLPKGHYFLALKVNDMQVHYLKVQKQ